MNYALFKLFFPDPPIPSFGGLGFPPCPFLLRSSLGLGGVVPSFPRIVRVSQREESLFFEGFSRFATFPNSRNQGKKGQG